MKKLFLVFSVDSSLLSHRKDLAVAALKQGYEVTIVAKDTGHKSQIMQMGFKFVDLPINRVGTNIFEELKTLYFLIRLYKKEKPDIVHHVDLKIVLWGGLAARLTKTRSVVNAVNGLGTFFADGNFDSLSKRIFMRIIKFSHNRSNITTIFQNKDDKSIFIDRNILRETQTFMIKGSGIDLETYAKKDQPHNDPIKIVFAARIIQEKGILDLIDAAEILRPEYENKCQILICGDIESNPHAISKEELDRRCDGRYIVYKGHCPNMQQILETSDIAVLPSYYREGLPKFLIEANAIGRPIITTDSVGCKDAVVDGYNGFVVPIKNARAIAEKLRILIDDPQLRAEMGDHARQYAEQNFSLANVIENHLYIYQSLTAK